MVDLEPSSPHLRIVEDNALDLLFHPDRWWGGWDLNPRSPVPETGIFYARMGILDQAVPTEGWSGPPPLSGGETLFTNKPFNRSARDIRLVPTPVTQPMIRC